MYSSVSFRNALCSRVGASRTRRCSQEIARQEFYIIRVISKESMSHPRFIPSRWGNVKWERQRGGGRVGEVGRQWEREWPTFSRTLGPDSLCVGEKVSEWVIDRQREEAQNTNCWCDDAWTAEKDFLSPSTRLWNSWILNKLVDTFINRVASIFFISNHFFTQNFLTFYGSSFFKVKIWCFSLFATLTACSIMFSPNAWEESCRASVGPDFRKHRGCTCMCNGRDLLLVSGT